MSMQSKGLPQIPEQTVAVARAAFPKGSVAIRVRDRLAEVFADEPFTEAFGVRGAPGMSPAVLSLVTVLQFAEDLTDRQAAAMAVRAIDWKYALGGRAHRYRLRYERGINGWTMPSSQTARDRLAMVFAQDGLALCQAAWAADAPGRIRETEAVRLLRQVLVQTYYVRTDARGREVITKRDADARWAAKGEEVFWCGYKVHLTETCHAPTEPEPAGRAGRCRI